MNSSIRRFMMLISPYRQVMLAVGGVLMAFSACMVMTGCAGLPTWLNDANQLLPLFTGTIGSVLTLLSTFSGNPELAAAATAAIAISNLVQKGITDIEAMVAEYKTNPSTTLLSNIENGAKAVIDNLNKMLADFNIPSGIGTPIVALAQLLLQQFEAWVAVIPALKVAMAEGHDIAAVRASIEHVSQLPMTAKAYKEAVAKILDAKVGDLKVDAALDELKSKVA